MSKPIRQGRSADRNAARGMRDIRRSGCDAGRGSAVGDIGLRPRRSESAGGHCRRRSVPRPKRVPRRWTPRRTRGRRVPCTPAGAAAAVGMAAAGVVIASGAPRRPRLRPRWWVPERPAASPTCLPTASIEGEQEDRERKAASGLLVLSVRAPNAEKRAEAEMILRAAGRHGTGGAAMPTGGRLERRPAVEDSFPASDPPANSGITGPRAVGARPASANFPTGGPHSSPKGVETAHQAEHEKPSPK